MKSQVASGALPLREPICEGQVQIHTQPIVTVLGWVSDSNPSPLLSLSQHAVQVLGPGSKPELVENDGCRIGKTHAEGEGWLTRNNGRR